MVQENIAVFETMDEVKQALILCTVNHMYVLCLFSAHSTIHVTSIPNHSVSKSALRFTFTIIMYYAVSNNQTRGASHVAAYNQLRLQGACDYRGRIDSPLCATHLVICQCLCRGFISLPTYCRGFNIYVTLNEHQRLIN